MAPFISGTGTRSPRFSYQTIPRHRAPQLTKVEDVARVWPKMAFLG